MRKKERPGTFALCGKMVAIEHVESTLCKLDESVRVKLACIVFNDSDAATRNLFIRNLVNLYDYAPDNFEPESKHIKAAMVAVGYDRHHASIRSVVNPPLRNQVNLMGSRRKFGTKMLAI